MRVLLSYVAIILCGIGNGFGAETHGGLKNPDFTIRPTPIRISSLAPYRPSGFLLGVVENRYGKATSIALAGVSSESPDGVAAQTIKAFTSNDPRTLSAIGKGFDMKSAEEHISLLMARFKISSDPILDRAYRLGSASYFVWHHDDPRQPFFPLLIVPIQGKHQYDPDGYGAPICQLIATMNRAIAEDSKAFSFRDHPPADYVVMPCSTDFGEHQLQLYFKGLPLKAEVFSVDNGASTPSPWNSGNTAIDAVLDFYAKLWRTLATNDIGAFLALHDEEDAIRLRKNLSDKLFLERYLAANLRNREVVYAIDGDDIAWLFYRFGNETSEVLSYDIIVKEPSGKLKRAHSTKRESIDAFLNDPKISKEFTVRFLQEPKKRD